VGRLLDFGNDTIARRPSLRRGRDLDRNAAAQLSAVAELTAVVQPSAVGIAVRRVTAGVGTTRAHGLERKPAGDGQRRRAAGVAPDALLGPCIRAIAELPFRLLPQQ